jgi:hypothetical protein
MIYPKYYHFSVESMSRRTYNTMSVPQPLHNISYVILVAQSSQTSSGPHQLMTFILWGPNHWKWLHQGNKTNGSYNLHITHTFNHKANMYIKSMAITTARTGVPCHTMQLSCLYFTCMSFYKSHLVNMFSTTFFSK